MIEETITVSPNGTSTTKRKFAQPIWQADTWLVEREDPDHHAPIAKQFRELKKTFEMLLKAYERDLPNRTSEVVALPSIGGEADPDAI